MNRHSFTNIVRYCSVPRRRGDEPFEKDMLFDILNRSPQARG